MTYLLDTDHVSILQRPGGLEYAAIQVHLNLHAAEGVGVSVVTFHEQANGAHNRVNRAKTHAELVKGYELFGVAIEVFRKFPLVAFDAAAAAVLGVLRAHKVRVKPMDLRIASVALAHKLTLVTRNVSDFGKVPGLHTEDWTK